MDGITNNTPTYLPHEIIENILCRSPVKSLLRFKCVSKHWNATISDPKFAQTHLQISKKSSSCLLEDHDAHRVQLVSFENNEMRLLSTFDYPSLKDEIRPPRGSCFLCHCDGLYVIFSAYSHGEYLYGLWNPSRRSFKKLDQYTFKTCDLLCGICYDPSLNDYKVVMGDEDHYAVFYCRRNYWSDLKEMNMNIFGFEDGENLAGVALKGSIYWVSKSSGGDGFEIVYFDGKDEELKSLCKVDARSSTIAVQLISSGYGLYLICYGLIEFEILFMKRYEWMELKGEVPLHGNGVWAVFCSHENKILIGSKEYVVIYDVSKTSIVRVEYPCNSISRSGFVYPYIESLFWD